MRHTKSLTCTTLSTSALLIYFATTMLPLSAATQRTSTSRYDITHTAYAKDYTARLKNHITWTEHSLRVFFVRNTEYTVARANAARNGFDYWVTAMRDYIVYQVVDNPENAQIVVRFDPATNDGYTTTSFRKGEITSSRIQVGVKRGRRLDLACIAAHEFGHALGIDGHSGVPSDLMYPVHHMGHACLITVRDLNTLAALYEVAPKVRITWKSKTPRSKLAAL